MKIKCGEYKHFKGKRYIVYGIATNLQNEEFVLYQQTYGDKAFWLRPTSMFLEEVDNNGQKEKRFRLLKETSSDNALLSLVKTLKMQSVTFTHSETEQIYKIFSIITKSKKIIVAPCESISSYLSDTQLAWRMGYDFYKIDGINFIHPASIELSTDKKLVIIPKDTDDNNSLDTELENKRIIEDINPCSIDLHISTNFFSKPKRKTIDIASMMRFSKKASDLWKRIYPKKINGFDGVALHPGQTIITHTLEKIELPADCAGKIEIKSTYARLALTVTASDFCNPGWKGYFPLTITNNGKHTIILHPKEKMLQISLIPTNGYIVNEYAQKSTYMNDDGTPYKFWHAQTIKHLQKQHYSDEIIEFYEKSLLSINSDNSENVEEIKMRFEDTFLLFCEKKLKHEKYNSIGNSRALLNKIWKKYKKSEQTKKLLMSKFFKVLASISSFIPTAIVACVDLFVNKQLQPSLLIWAAGSLLASIIIGIIMHVLTPNCFCSFEKLEFETICKTKIQ